LLPAIAAGALLVLAALQLGWSRPITLPPADAITPVRLSPVSLLPVPVPAGGRPLFAVVASGGAATAQQPLDGAKAIGVATRGGLTLAFVQSADGRVASVRMGQFVAGWQLVGIGADRLRFRRGGEAASLLIGAADAPAAARQAER
jgi:hypothetical protein